MIERILLIEDDAGAPGLGDCLRGEGYAVEAVRDAKVGLDRALDEAFGLILLDISSPSGSSVDVCRDLRQQGLFTPVLIVSTRKETVDKVLALKVGADDYVTRPFETLELLARVEALLRRAPRSAAALGTIHHFGAIRVDLRRAEVWRDGRPVGLSAREFQLLRYFIEHRGDVLSRQELLREVWRYGSTTSTRTVDVHVAGLRQKLESNTKRPQLILTRLGLGYKFDPASTASSDRSNSAKWPNRAKHSSQGAFPDGPRAAAPGRRGGRPRGGADRSVPGGVGC